MTDYSEYQIATVDVIIATAAMMDGKMSFEAFKTMINRDDLESILCDAGIERFQPKIDDYASLQRAVQIAIDDSPTPKRNKQVDVPTEAWQKDMERKLGRTESKLNSLVGFLHDEGLLDRWGKWVALNADNKNIYESWEFN